MPRQASCVTAVEIRRVPGDYLVVAFPVPLRFRYQCSRKSGFSLKSLLSQPSRLCISCQALNLYQRPSTASRRSAAPGHMLRKPLIDHVQLCEAKSNRSSGRGENCSHHYRGSRIKFK